MKAQSEGEAESGRVSHMWIVVAVLSTIAAVFFSADAHEQRLRRAHDAERLVACVEERRQCGKDLDWCQTTVRGTLFYITEKLLGDGGADEGRPGR